jgi:peptidyl-tRNA hydrolase
MSKVEEYRANAAECDRMARTARDEAERRTWQDMAQSWSRMAEEKSAAKVQEPRD